MEEQLSMSNMENNQQVNDADAALELKENFVKEFVADLEKASNMEHSSFEIDESQSDMSNTSLVQEEKEGLRSNPDTVSPSELQKAKTDFQYSGNNSSPPSKSSDILRTDVSPLIGIENYSSSASASSTPRDESSSGSPSPIPEDGKQAKNEKPAVTLGKDLSLMMQALNSLQTPEEKIAALCKKYADLLDQQKLLQKQIRISQRKQSQVSKEKEQLQTDHNKAVTARSRLESLCRELQKRNKALKEEQNKKSLEEVNLRQEMAAEFQATLDKIQYQMKTAVDGSNKLQSENERIGGKLNEIVEKYQEREAAMEKLVKQHNLQEQLVTAKLEKNLLEQQEEREKNTEEKQKLLEQLIERTVLYESKVKQEKELRAQLQYYSEKFEDFQSTLEKSNEVFTSFRTEMDKMSKKLKQAEKYRATMQKKWEDSTKALANTVEYTQQLEAKQARLEKLSRALQSERNELAQRLRQYENGEKKTTKENSRKKKNNENKKDTVIKNTEEKSEKPVANGLNCNAKDSTISAIPAETDSEKTAEQSEKESQQHEVLQEDAAEGDRRNIETPVQSQLSDNIITHSDSMVVAAT